MYVKHFSQHRHGKCTPAQWPSHKDNITTTPHIMSTLQLPQFSQTMPDMWFLRRRIIKKLLKAIGVWLDVCWCYSFIRLFLLPDGIKGKLVCHKLLAKWYTLTYWTQCRFLKAIYWWSLKDDFPLNFVVSKHLPVFP